MSAANMDLNVQTLSQIGGALQKLNADGTIDEAGTQQVLAQLQQQLGTNFTQTTVSDNLHTDFVKEGGGLPTFVVAAIAIAASIVTAGAAAAAMGVALASMTLGESMVVGALSAMASSAASQLASGQGLNFGSLLEAGAVGALTAGITNGITYNSTTGSFGLGNLDQGLNSLPQNVSTLGQLAGISNIGNSLGQVAQAGSTTAENLPGQLAALGATATINAGVGTAIEGGSFLNNLKAAGISDIAAVGAYTIGDTSNPLTTQNVLEHAALGCAASALSGTGCGGGAIGGATSALLSPSLVDFAGGAPNLTDADRAGITMIAMLAGGGVAGLLRQNTVGAATAAENEALNNSEQDHRTPQQKEEDEIKAMLSKEKAALGESRTVVKGTDAEGNPITVLTPPPPGMSGATAPSALQQATSLFSSNAPGMLSIGGATFAEVPNAGNAAIFSGATDAQVQQYFMALTGTTQLPAARVIPGKGTLYVVDTPGGNFTLRDFSSSSGQTGPAWTIDIPKGAVGTTYNPEIKFFKGGSK